MFSQCAKASRPKRRVRLFSILPRQGTLSVLRVMWSIFAYAIVIEAAELEKTGKAPAPGFLTRRPD